MLVVAICAEKIIAFKMKVETAYSMWYDFFSSRKIPEAIKNKGMLSTVVLCIFNFVSDHYTVC